MRHVHAADQLPSALAAVVMLSELRQLFQGFPIYITIDATG
jgi:hypothetical protein